ncbi:MAG: hypothetical protein Q8L40_06845 [Burkholderiales bacterium]|nr:hypothetical protein [Burkholderiales bacterium]
MSYHLSWPTQAGTTRRTTMSKGQQRSNKEKKKPKKQKQPAAVAVTFIKKPKANEPIKNPS